MANSSRTLGMVASIALTAMKTERDAVNSAPGRSSSSSAWIIDAELGKLDLKLRTVRAARGWCH